MNSDEASLMNERAVVPIIIIIIIIIIIYSCLEHHT